MKFTPRGLSDAFDASEKFPGACQKLTNLIFDSSNPEILVSRPGNTLLIDFNSTGTWGGAGFISVHISIGVRIYGMISTQRNPGNDEPFCFDTSTGAFVKITGVTAANTPTSPATQGDWTPPTMAAVGTMIFVTHPGFSGKGKYLWGNSVLWGSVAQGGSGGLWGDSWTFGIIDVTDPMNPTWTSTTTTTYPLTGVPVAVANFNNRGYFAVGNAVQYTDVLTNPPTRTNANQVVTVGDDQPLTALSGLPVQTAGAGIVQTLSIFKQTQIWQLGGDPATWNLGLDQVSLTVGTNSPRSIAQSTTGLYFSSTGGPYFLDLLGALRPLTNNLQTLDPDIVTPFENAINPTRWAGAYNSTIYRVCGETNVRGIGGINDYWFDEHRRRWNGPHTFSYDCASAFSGFFVLSSVYYPGKLIQSVPEQKQGFVNNDLNTPITSSLLSASFPKTNDMFTKQVAESQIELSASTLNSITYYITAQDEQGNIINSVQISIANPGNLWGNFRWGDGTLWSSSNLWGGGALWGPAPSFWGSGVLWGQQTPPAYWASATGSGLLWGGGVQNIPHTWPVPWTVPLVFEKMQLAISCTASQEVGIGTFYARYQQTGYMTTGHE